MLKNKYIKYDSRITLEIFTAIVDKLESIGSPCLVKDKSIKSLFSEFIYGYCIMCIYDDNNFNIYKSKYIHSSDTELLPSELLGFNPFAERIVIHCVTQNQWNELLLKFNPRKLDKSKFTRECGGTCVTFKDSGNQSNVGCYGSYNYYNDKHDAEIISFNQWCEIYDKPLQKVAQSESKEFVLPEKWSVRVTDESRDKIGSWRSNGSISKCWNGWCLSYYNSTRGYGVREFNPDYPEITYEQFLKYVIGEKVEEFKLPEKWYVSLTHETRVTLEAWTGGSYYRYYGYVGYDKSWGSTEPDGTEITIEQFKQYVLKESKATNDSFKLPSKWCVADVKPVKRFFEDYNNGGYTCGGNAFLHYPKIDGGCHFTTIQSGYTLITLEQFQRYVKKAPIETTKEVESANACITYKTDTAGQSTVMKSPFLPEPKLSPIVNKSKYFPKVKEL